MADETLISYAQNGEDVVLWRALGHVHGGVYVDVGGWDPDVDSVTRLFHERGWRGIDVEPVPEFAAKFRDRRPLNDVVQAAITDEDVDHVVLHRFGSTGLSTVDDTLAERHGEHGLVSEDVTVPARRLDDVLEASEVLGPDIHFLKIDVEGAEERVVRSVDLRRWRPWVLLIEATEPNSLRTTHDRWEAVVVEAGYTFTLFDGLSRFYVSPDHPELREALSVPASPVDGFVRAAEVEAAQEAAQLRLELDDAQREAQRWRSEAVGYWANAMARTQASADEAREAEREADRASRQLQRVRDKLEEARSDRKRLRARVQRLESRLTVRDSAPAGSAVADRGRVSSRLRRALRKVRG